MCLYVYLYRNICIYVSLSRPVYPYTHVHTATHIHNIIICAIHIPCMKIHIRSVRVCMCIHIYTGVTAVRVL